MKHLTQAQIFAGEKYVRRKRIERLEAVKFVDIASVFVSSRVRQMRISSA